MFDYIILEQEQEDLLKSMVEAVRNTSRVRRSRFILVDGGMVHSGLPGGFSDAHIGDLEMLTSYNLLSKTLNPRGKPVFDVDPFGNQYYEHLQKRADEPVNQIEKEVCRYIGRSVFSKRHLKAFQKWLAAADQLWGSESESQLTTIGHLCREAMQEFAEGLVSEFGPEKASADKQKIINRIAAVLEQRKRHLGGRKHGC